MKNLSINIMNDFFNRYSGDLKGTKWGNWLFYGVILFALVGLIIFIMGYQSETLYDLIFHLTTGYARDIVISCFG
jgi:hypothetical protein